jgi:hypothetical protein
MPGAPQKKKHFHAEEKGFLNNHSSLNQPEEADAL